MDTTLNTLAFSFGPLGFWEILIILVIALLIFGKRLPEVGRSMGKGIVEFKKGLQGIEDDVDDAVNKAGESKPEPPQQLDAQTTDASKEHTVQEKEHA